MIPHVGLLLASGLVVFPLLAQSSADGSLVASQPDPPLLAAPLPAETLPPEPMPAEPTRLATNAFGAEVEVEVRDLPAVAAKAAIRAALAEIHALAQLSDPDGSEPGGVGALNRAAAKGPQAVDPRAHELMLRSLQFCIWSDGAYGPLGGGIYELWSDLRAQDLRPSSGDLRRVVGRAECARLMLRTDPSQPGVAATGHTAELAEGSRVDLRGMARGFAVDRANTILQQAGSFNSWVEIGNVRSARGDGPDGRGWLVTLPPVPGGDEPLDRVWLRDQALALIHIDPQAQAALIDQRSGVPAQGVVSVVAVTDLAVDAQPLVSALFVLGHREGHMRLGKLEPRPSVYWLLGQGIGTPLEATYHWSDLDRVWQR